MARRRRTETIGDLGHYILGRIDPHGKRFESQAVSIWPEVAGAEINKHTRGFAMRDGELVVFVDSPAWANELSLMGERLRDGINSKTGTSEVRSIRFTVSKKVKEGQREETTRLDTEEHYAPDVTPSVALSEDELNQARYIAGAVPDPDLRERALRVMIKDLERKKGARTLNGSKRAAGEPKGPESKP